MKLVIEQKSLTEALGHVRYIVEKRNISPVLGNVLIEAQDGRLFLTTTDLDVSIREETKATIVDPGSTTINIATLYEIVCRIPDGSEIELKSNEENGQVVVKSGKARFQLPSISADQFSASLAADLPNQFTLTGAELYALLRNTAFSMSDVDSHYTMNGVYLHSLKQDDREILRAVATDGHRLAYAQQPAPKSCMDMPGVIIPRKTIRLILKLLEKNRDFDVNVSVSLTQVIFAFNTIHVQSRLIDGQFPNYVDVIPTQNTFELKINRRDFLEAVDRVSLLSQDKTNGIKMSINPGSLTLSAASPNAGSAVEEVAIDYSGDAIETGFNAAYLSQIGEHIESKTLVGQLHDENTPMILYGQDEGENLYVLMPIRV